LTFQQIYFYVDACGRRRWAAAKPIKFQKQELIVRRCWKAKMVLMMKAAANSIFPSDWNLNSKLNKAN